VEEVEDMSDTEADDVPVPVSSTRVAPCTTSAIPPPPAEIRRQRLKLGRKPASEPDVCIDLDEHAPPVTYTVDFTYPWGFWPDSS
jgi:hypothetical protein